MKLIASDYDGTLNRNNIVSDHDIAAIANWQTAGNLFGLVTGRGFSSSRHEMQYYGIKADFYICNNGSAIFDKKETPLYCAKGNPAILKPLVEAIMDINGLRAAISCGKERYCVILDEKRDMGSSEQWLPFSHLQTFSKPFTQLDTNARTEKNAEMLATFINKNYEKYVFAHQNGINVDITPVGNSKSNGIAMYINKTGLSKESVFVIGDNTNDIEMIRAFHGYAVASGNPIVLSLAKKVYPSVGDCIYDLLSH